MVHASRTHTEEQLGAKFAHTVAAERAVALGVGEAADCRDAELIPPAEGLRTREQTADARHRVAASEAERAAADLGIGRVGEGACEGRGAQEQRSGKGRATALTQRQLREMQPCGPGASERSGRLTSHDAAASSDTLPRPAGSGR